MSVVEFFLAYWDWYLLVGAGFTLDGLLNCDEDAPALVRWTGSVVIGLLWVWLLISRLAAAARP